MLSDGFLKSNFGSLTNICAFAHEHLHTSRHFQTFGIPGNVQGEVVGGLENAGIMEVVSSHGRGLELDEL